jgi:hypothetical protein
MQLYNMLHKAGLEMYPPPPPESAQFEAARSKWLIQHFYSKVRSMTAKSAPELARFFRRFNCGKDKGLPSAQDFVMSLWPVIAAHMHEVSEVRPGLAPSKVRSAADDIFTLTVT